MMDMHVIPECYIDTELCKALIPPATRYNHQKGCPNVVKVMREKFTNDFALGIVDKDKQELAYFENFQLIAEIPENVQLLKGSGHHYLIYIRPTMEKWIISTADEIGLSLNDYNLPHDFSELKKITKTSKSEEDDMHSADFRKLFSVFRKSSSVSVTVLAFWVGYLKEHPYNADLAYVKKETEFLLE